MAAFALFGAAGAQAASPQDICKDLQDGKVDGTYTSAEWTAFLHDSTVQGYCSPIVIVTPPPTTTPPVTQTPPAGTPVPLTPTSGVAGAQATKTSTPKAAPQATVKGTQHTVSAPVSATAAAPLATTKSSGTLPFTGAQLALFALVGLALLATGFVLRSTARSGGRP